MSKTTTFQRARPGPGAGAQLLLPAGVGVPFEHTPAFCNEDITGDAGLVIRPIRTPGHTCARRPSGNQVRELIHRHLPMALKAIASSLAAASGAS